MREFFESSPSRNAASSEPTLAADFEVMRQRLLDCLDSFTRLISLILVTYLLLCFNTLIWRTARISLV